MPCFLFPSRDEGLIFGSWILGSRFRVILLSPVLPPLTCTRWSHFWPPGRVLPTWRSSAINGGNALVSPLPLCLLVRSHQSLRRRAPRSQSHRLVVLGLSQSMAPTSPTSRSSSAGGAPNIHTDFLKRLTERESKNRITKRPTPLSAKQHAALREQLKGVQVLKPVYAEETEINSGGMLGKWKRYVV